MPWRHHRDTILRTLLPASCALCGGDSHDLLCPDCEARFFSAESGGNRWRCHRCADPLAAAASLCGACLAHPPAFDATLVAADYAMPVDQLVLQLKFGHRLALAALFARLLRDAVLRRQGRWPPGQCADAHTSRCRRRPLPARDRKSVV